MTETKENMKITKFKVITERIHKYLMRCDSCGGYVLLSYYPVFIDKYVENEYVRVIRQQFMCTPEELETINLSTKRVSHNSLEYIHNSDKNQADIELLFTGEGQTSISGSYRGEDKNCLIFWRPLKKL